jgi:heterokaryon incompatibility protein (HET)
MRSDTFSYKELPDGYIRLIKLESDSDGLFYIMRRFSLRAAKKNRYRALSYRWISQERPNSVYMNYDRVRIAKNLHEFFKVQSRSKYRESWLWIDALCINQEDQEEKTGQIRMMGEIYSNAREVLV